MNVPLRISLVSIVALLLAACAGTMLQARRLDDPQAVTSRVVVDSAPLHAVLRAAVMRVERMDDKALEIEVHLLNDSAAPLPVRMRVVFRNPANKVVDRHDEPPVVIAPGQTHILITRSPAPQAQEFTVEVYDAPR